MLREDQIWQATDALPRCAIWHVLIGPRDDYTQERHVTAPAVIMAVFGFYAVKDPSQMDFSDISLHLCNIATTCAFSCNIALS